jgi:hypothetical protein
MLLAHKIALDPNAAQRLRSRSKRNAYPCACFEIIGETLTSSSLPMSQPWWKRPDAMRAAGAVAGPHTAR